MTATLDLARIRPGFAEPVAESQRVFRAVMDAMARPGSVAELGFGPEPPAGLGVAAAAAGLTLFDFETLVWLDPALDGEPADWLRFHCGCPLTADPGQAAFAVVADMAAAPALAAFHQGEAKYPDRSTTVILQVEALEGGTPLILTGPGIRGATTFAPRGLPDRFWDHAQANHEQFQFGVDLMLTSAGRMVCLPRSTRIEIQGG